MTDEELIRILGIRLGGTAEEISLRRKRPEAENPTAVSM
jgi:hypothetical protein